MQCARKRGQLGSSQQCPHSLSELQVDSPAGERVRRRLEHLRDLHVSGQGVDQACRRRSQYARLSAEEEHAAETLETLKFAGRCSQVETKAKKNVVSLSVPLLFGQYLTVSQLQSTERALIQAKDKEIEVLKRRLQVMAGQTQPQPSSSILDQSDQMADVSEVSASLWSLWADSCSSPNPWRTSKPARPNSPTSLPNSTARS